MTIRLMSAVFIIVMLGCLSLCVPVRAEEVVRIGVSAALTGPNREWGERTLAGIKMRLQEWELSGGRPRVELVIRDDGNDLARSKQNVIDLVENEKVIALIGPDITKFILAEREYLKEKKVPAISSNSTSSDIGRECDWIFRLMFDNVFQGRSIAEYAYNVLGLRRAGVIINTIDSYPAAISDAFRGRFEELGGEVVRVERFSWKYCEKDAYDFEPILESLAAVKPDAILVPLLAPMVVDVVNQSLSVDLGPVTFLGTDTWESGGLLEAGGNNLLNAYYVSGFNSNSMTPEMEHYRAMYELSNEAYAELSSVFGYDAMSLMLHAVSEADSSEGVRDVLYGLCGYRLASGPITIDPERGTLRPGYVRRVIKKDHLFSSEYESTVWPEGMEGE